MRSNLSDLLLIVAFGLATAGLGALSLARPVDREVLAKENRSPAPLPALTSADDAKHFPGRFEAFLGDRLAFRESLLNAHAIAKVRGLGVSSSDKVLLGKDDWLFLNEESERVAGHRPTVHEQFLAWARTVAIRAEWLQKQKIEYLFVLTPEKHFVYPELLSPAYGPPQVSTPTHRLVGWAEGEIGSVNDPRNLILLPFMKVAKTQRQIYFRTDTHWNDFGAYVAYREILARLAVKHPAMQPLPLEAFDEVQVADFPGDLGRMLHLPDPPTEPATFLHLRSPKARRLDVPVPLDPRLHSPAYLVPQAWGTGDRRLPRGIIFHDSFSERLLLPLLAEHFDILIYAPSTSLDPALIAHFRPDIVIQQIVERHINHHAPLLPEEVRRPE